jgi:hypothetical protein
MSDWLHNLPVPWMVLLVFGFTYLLAAMGLCATGVAAAVLLIAAHDRPFNGQISVTPELLLQIMPDAPTDR